MFAEHALLAPSARLWSEREASEETKGEAERLLRRATARLVTAHVELGYVYTARGDDTSAYTHAGKAAILAPDDPRVAQLRAAIAAGRGR